MAKNGIVIPKYKELIKSFGAYSISNALSQLLMIIYAFLLANHLGPALFGGYTGHLSFILLFSFVINWGFDTFFLFQSGTLTQPKEINIFNGQIIILKLSLGAIWILFLVLLSQLIPTDFYKTSIILFASLDTLADSLFLTQLTALNIKSQANKLSLLLFSSRLARLIGGAVGIFLGITSIQTFFLIRLFTTIFFMLLSFYFATPHFIKYSFHKLKNLWRHSWSYGISETLALVYAQVDVSILAILLGDSATGLYTTSSRLIIALFTIPNAGYLLVIPKLRKIYKSDRVKFNESIVKILIGFLIVGLVLFLGILLSGKWLVSLILGDAYAISGELLQILSVVLLLKSFSFGLAAIIVVLDKQKIRLIPQFITSISAILLNIIIIPIFGLYGAAYVYIISEAILLTGYIILVFRSLHSHRLTT